MFFDEYVFGNEQTVEKVLSSMKETIKESGVVTIEDFRLAAGLMSGVDIHNYEMGWSPDQVDAMVAKCIELDRGAYGESRFGFKIVGEDPIKIFSRFDRAPSVHKYALDKRPSKREYYLGIARAVAARSTCTHNRTGAIIVKHDNVISTGYKGMSKGAANCCDTGECLVCTKGEPCPAVFAETNAMLAAGSRAFEADMYVVGIEEVIPETPSDIWALAKNVGIARIYREQYDDRVDKEAV